MRAHFIAGMFLCVLSQIASATDKYEIYKPDRDSEGGFIDVSLRIESMKCDTWSNCVVLAGGTYKGRPVAVEVSILANGSQGRIAYRSVGKRSDDFLSALAALYKLPRPKKIFSTNAEADIILLDATKQKLLAKVFFAANGPESRYAELYTNIDKAGKVLEISEKDPEYRKNVLRGLTQ